MSESFLPTLENIIASRLRDGEQAQSYTASLAAAGVNRIAQKIGEEGVEVAIAAAAGAEDSALIGEAADLVYHLCVLLSVRGLTLADVEAELIRRHRD